MAETGDWYMILEIPHGSSDSVIMKAYRRLSLKYHPDRNLGNPSANENFIRLSQAKDFLLDVEKRKEYDNGILQKNRKMALSEERLKHTDAQKQKLKEEFLRRERIEINNLRNQSDSNVAGMTQSADKMKRKISELRENGQRKIDEFSRKRANNREGTSVTSSSSSHGVTFDNSKSSLKRKSTIEDDSRPTRFSDLVELENRVFG